MSRLQSVRENWTEITNRLMEDKPELARFLRFAAGMYKQSFSDAALIYHQNPNATKVATLETWNKLGRLVSRGEHSIAVFGESDKCRYLFDISQTNGKKIPELWHLDESLSEKLTAVINKKYGRGCKDINETIAAMSIDNTRSHLTEMMSAIEKLNIADKDIAKYQQSFVSAVRFVVTNRCNSEYAGGLNLNAVDLFKDNKDLIRFCDLVQKSAKDTLLEMERESEQQTAEIRGIIETAERNREISHTENIEINDISEPIINTEETIFEPAENEVYIAYNEILEASDLPVLTDKKLIEGILKSDRFLNAKRA